MARRKRPRPAAQKSGQLNWGSPRVQAVGGGLLITALCLWAYSPSLGGDFLLDDNGLLTQSKLVHASNGLARFWFSTDPSDYWPLTNSAFWLQWRLWGMNPTGYHVTNLLLHLTAVFLLWAILRKLAIPGAFLAAALFAVHPVNIESVAWIAQLKNTLAMVFFLLSIWWYLKAEEGRETRGEGRSWYWWSLGAFLLAMLSKGSVAVLPVVLLGLIWWQRRRIDLPDVLRTVPFFVVSAALTAVNMWFQTHGKEMVVRDVTFAQRMAGAGAALWFYLGKAMAPIQLVFIYPNWTIRADVWLWWLPMAAALAMTSVLWWNYHRSPSGWGRTLLFAWGFFCLALLPVLGFTDVGFMKHSLVADHYQHIALIAVAALLAACWATWYRQARGGARMAAAVVAIGMVGTLTLLTWNQNHLYADPITLYSATLEHHPDCWIAHSNLGNAYTMARQPELAVKHCQQALALKPDDPDVLTNMGLSLGALGKTQESLEYLQQALKVRPDHAPAESNLGLALITAGRHREAIDHLQRALQLDPNYAAAELNLGSAWLGIGRTQEAVDCFQRALQLKPDYAEAFYNLGNVAAAAGDLEKARQNFGQAVRVKPNYVEAYNNLGGAYLQAGQARDAIAPFQQALRIDPNCIEAHCNLANALSTIGRVEEAIAHLQTVIQLQPDYTNAWVILARAYAAAQQPGDAIHAGEMAAKFAAAQKQSALVQQIEDWLTGYRAELTAARGAASDRRGMPAKP